MRFREGFFSYSHIHFESGQNAARSIKNADLPKWRAGEGRQRERDKKRRNRTNTILITDRSTAHIQNTRTKKSKRCRRQWRIDNSIGNIDAFTKTTHQMGYYVVAKAFKLSIIWHGFNLFIISLCACFVFAFEPNSSGLLARNSVFFCR